MGLLDSFVPVQLGPYSLTDAERRRLLKGGLLSAGLTMMSTPTGTGSPLMGISKGLLAGLDSVQGGALDNFERQHKYNGIGNTPAELQTFKAMTAGLGEDEIAKARRVYLGLDGRASNAGFGFDTVETADGRKRQQRRNPRTGAVEVLMDNEWVPMGETPSAGPLNEPLPPAGPMDRGAAMSYVQGLEQSQGVTIPPAERLRMIDELVSGRQFDVQLPSEGLLAPQEASRLPTTGLLGDAPGGTPSGGLLGPWQPPVNPTNPSQSLPPPPNKFKAPGGQDPFASRKPEDTVLETERAKNLAAREQMPYQTAQAGAEADAKVRAEALANSQTAGAQGTTAGTIEASRQQGQDAAKEFATIQGKAQMATAENANLSALRDSLKNTYTGPGADLALGAKRAASLFGIDVEGLGEAEAARALSNRMALALRNPAGGEGMPGAMSDADRNFLVQSIPNLKSSPAGWRAMIDMRLALNASAIKQAQYAEDLRRQGVPVQDIPGLLRDHANAHPIFKAKPKGSSGLSPQEQAELDELRARFGRK